MFLSHLFNLHNTIFILLRVFPWVETISLLSGRENFRFRLLSVAQKHRMLKLPSQNPTPWENSNSERDIWRLDIFFFRFVLQRQVSDIHVVCGLLKDFLRNLAEPLLTYELWSKFVDAASKLINFLRLVILSYYILCVDISGIKPWIKVIPVKWYDIITSRVWNVQSNRL